MIIRCDNCSVSLQLDESKVPNGNFTVRCPRCQNMIRVQPGAPGKGSSSVRQLEATSPAPAIETGKEEFSAKESEFEINSAMRLLLSALQKDSKVVETDDTSDQKPRRVLVCMGQKRDTVAKILSDAGYKVYLAQNPAQANERMREGKTEIVIFSPDFASEFGGAAILQQKMNAMYSSERRRVFLISVEENGNTLSAHEAFIRNLNLIVNSNDVEKLPLILNRALRDFNELYHYFNTATGVSSV